MLAELKPYPQMRDSGVEWLGEVPTHWGIAQVKRYYSVQLGKMLQPLPRDSQDRQVRYLKARNVQWFDLDTSNIDTMYASADEIHRYGVSLGDLLVCEGGEGGRCAMATGSEDIEPCIIQNALHRVRPRVKLGEGSSLNDYLQYILSVVSSAGWFDVLNDKATIAHFTAEKFGALPIPMPAHAEQTAIARFLDHATDRIDRYIRAKKRLIALLDEYKQVLIHQAVTGQFDVRTDEPYLEYKESGEEWLGRVPTHWGVLHLGRITLDRCDGPFGSGLKSSHYTPDGIRVVRLQNIGHSEFNGADVAYIAPEHYATLGDHSVEPGDVLIAGLGDERHPAGRACIAPEAIGPAMVKADCFRFRLDKKIAHPEFIALHLTATATAATATLSTGATRQRINLQSTSSRRIPLPSLPEQLKIVEHTSRQTYSIRIMEQLARQEIGFLRDYRSRLIADAVTGKLDVREVAATLPEIDPLASDDQTDESLDSGNTPTVDQENQPTGVAG